MDGVQIVEGVEALGPCPELAGGLRAAEEQNADQGDLVAVKVKDVGEAMLEFGDAAIGSGGSCEALVRERVESAADGLFVEFHDGIAVGFLVGGVLEGVQRQRVVVRGGDFFFDEAAEDASLDGRQVEVHLNMIHDGSKRGAPRRYRV